jgi:hypothetical protein
VYDCSVRYFCCESVITGLCLKNKECQERKISFFFFLRLQRRNLLETKEDIKEKSTISAPISPLPSRLANIICEQV